MKYFYDLIHTDDKLKSEDGLYSLILLRASGLSLTLNGVRCFLDGSYLLCLSEDDTLSFHNGTHQCLSLRFLPYFYNVNLSHRIIKNAIYEKMRSKYGYPSFYLFCERDENYFGIINLLDDEYSAIRVYMGKISKFIEENEINSRWSCNARSEMISILNIAENAHHGVQEINDNNIISYIKENVTSHLSLEGLCNHFRINRTTLSNTVKELTGLTPMQYVLEERLNQTRPELLFTNIAIGDLATKYGFGDPNYYIRTFKKRFGVTPLQYRTEGKNERIKNQNKYRLSNKQSMTIAEFESYLKKGLGRAVLLLKKETDASLFRQSVIDHAMTEPRYDPQCENSHGFYLAELFDCFTDKVDMISEVLTAYVNCDSDRCAHIQNLEAWIKLDIPGARETLWSIYNRLFNIVKNEEKATSDNPVDYERDDMKLCAEILYPVSHGSLKYFLRNAVILTTESDRYDIACFCDFISCTGMESDKSFISVFDELRAEDPRAEMVYQAYVEYSRRNEKPAERQNPSKQTTDKKPTNWREAVDFAVSKGNPMLPVSPSLWKNIPKSEHAEIIESALTEKNTLRRLAIIRQLLRYGDEVLNSNGFDPTPFIATLESSDETTDVHLGKETIALNNLGMIVAKTKHSAVRDYALRSLPLSLKYPTKRAYAYAVEALLTNYQTGDDAVLYKHIKSISDEHDLHGVGFDVSDSNAPVSTDILMYLYENTPCTECRHKLFKRLTAIQTTNTELLQFIEYIKSEAKHDSCEKTRALAENERTEK